MKLLAAVYLAGVFTAAYVLNGEDLDDVQWAIGVIFWPVGVAQGVVDMLRGTP